LTFRLPLFRHTLRSKIAFVMPNTKIFPA